VVNDYDLQPTETGLTDLPELTKHNRFFRIGLGDTVTGQYA